MKFIVELKPKAEKDLKNMDRTVSRRVYDALISLENGLEGDIKKLTNHFPEYRLRVGDWRVIFDIEGDKIIIYRIRHRKEAYR